MIYNQLNPSRAAQFAYDKFKAEYQVKESQMFSRVIASRESFINNFYLSCKTIRPDLGISKNSFYLTFFSDKFPCKYIKQKDIASFNLKDNTLNIRRKGSPKVTKVIKFRREVSPEKLIKYIERFAEK